jgi:hypothetical protein
MSFNTPQKIANTFDPSVSGLAAPIGSWVETYDGTKAWMKWGTGNTQWTPLHPVTMSSGITRASWDTSTLVANLACDTLGGFEVVWQGTVTGTPQTVLRINGVQPSAETAFLFSGGAVCSPTALAAVPLITDSFKTGGRFTITARCRSPLSGARLQVIEFNTAWDAAAGITMFHGGQIVPNANPVGEIQSIGVGLTSGTISAISTLTIYR